MESVYEFSSDYSMNFRLKLEVFLNKSFMDPDVIYIVIYIDKFTGVNALKYSGLWRINFITKSFRDGEYSMDPEKDFMASFYDLVHSYPPSFLQGKEFHFKAFKE